MPKNQTIRLQTAMMTFPTVVLTLPSATAFRAMPPVMQPAELQPTCWIVFSTATSLVGHQPKLYLLIEIWRRPVGAPKLAQKPDTDPPRIDPKMQMRMLCLRGGVSVRA